MPVSIVIPNYNGATLLRKHLPDVLSVCREQDEVLVVDDASTDESLQLLQSFGKKVRVVSNTRNQRFAASCNRGVEAAKHEVVILLNSDVSPLAGCVERMELLLKDRTLFAVGCIELDGQEKSGRSAARFERGMYVHSKHPQQKTGYTAWATGGSMAFRKTHWETLGGMDTLYRPAYYEDIDLSYRAWKSGLRVVVDEYCVVHHHHESTNVQTFGRWNMQVMSFKNSFIFFWKNITDVQLWSQHFCWLPYHLAIGGIKTKGALLFGFVKAVLQLPEIIRYRKHTSFNKTDAEVIQEMSRT